LRYDKIRIPEKGVRALDSFILTDQEMAEILNTAIAIQNISG
jgi:hypothetical protein